MASSTSTAISRGHVKVRRGPCGLHLFDRQSGLNILMDEISVPSATWHRAPRHVSIALTNACDLSCSYCYASKESANQPFDKVRGWVDELDANGCLGIGFGGGEPTLYKQLPELCRYVTENTSLAVTLTTHGHHLTSLLIEQLDGNVNFVRVSVDGVGATYERLRGRSFDQLELRLKGLRSFAPFGINVVVNADTISELDATVSFAVASGAKELLLLPEIPNRMSDGAGDRVRSELLSWVTCYTGSLPLCISENGAEKMPTFEPLRSETGLAAYAHVDAFGQLKGSSFQQMGVPICPAGIMAALKILKLPTKECAT